VEGEDDDSSGDILALIPSVNCILVRPIGGKGWGGLYKDFPGFLHTKISGNDLAPTGVVRGGGELWDFREHGGHFMI
jgi:hypothetical protein